MGSGSLFRSKWPQFAAKQGWILIDFYRKIYLARFVRLNYVLLRYIFLLINTPTRLFNLITGFYFPPSRMPAVSNIRPHFELSFLEKNFIGLVFFFFSSFINYDFNWFGCSGYIVGFQRAFPSFNKTRDIVRWNRKRKKK